MPENPVAAEVLHDDKNIDDEEKAARQAVQIILDYRKAQKLRSALSDQGLSSQDKLGQIQEALSNKGKGGEDVRE